MSEEMNFKCRSCGHEVGSWRFRNECDKCHNWTLVKIDKEIKVTPFSIGGASGDALYVYIDGRKVLSGKEKVEIERRVNEYESQQREIAKLKELMRKMLAQSEGDILCLEELKNGLCSVNELYRDNLMPECMVKAKELLSEEK